MELHVFPEGKHGISLSTAEIATGDEEHDNPHTAAQWMSLWLNWLNMQFR